MQFKHGRRVFIALSSSIGIDYTAAMNLSKAVVLVTGANRGIGRALVEALLAKDVRKVYATARNAGTLDAVVALDPARVVPLQLDITNPQQIGAAAVAAHDVTLLINNAGSLAFGTVLDSPTEFLVQDMATNYHGTLNMVRAFVPVLEAHDGGGIVNLLTVVALASMPGLGGYNASKAAAWSMTQSIRATLRSQHIEVFGVYPGAVDTDMIRAFEMPKTSPQAVAAAILTGIEAGTEDIFPDPMAAGFYESWKADHKAVERQFGAM